MYKDLYDRAKKIVKKDACMEFYDAARHLYLGTSACNVSLETRLSQVRDGRNCRNNEVLYNPNNTGLHLPAKAYQALSDATAT